MTISPTSPTVTPRTADRPRTPEEAAKQFEAVLVRQFVETMTEGLFKSTTGGVSAVQADAQRDAMTTALTDELVEGGSLRFRDLLLRQWGKTPSAASAPEEASAPTADTTRRSAPTMSGDDHFDLLRRAAAHR